MRRFLPLCALSGCMEYQISDHDEDSSLSGISVEEGPDAPDSDDDDDGSDSSGSGSSGSGSSGSGSGGSSGSSGSGGSSGSSSSSSSDDDDEEDEAGSSFSSARDAVRGDIIISELMIDPYSASDAQGEWVELWNRSDDWVDLDGALLADRGVDSYELDPEYSDALIVGPGEFLIVCADPDWWSNGGVDCDATVLYQTFGGGFALSNTEDEVLLISDSGSTLDSFEYGNDFAVVGASMGVDPDAATVSGNDDEDDWCDQWGSLPFGDGGSPGEENDWCW